MPPIELILYLEPSSDFKKKFQDLLEQCKQKFGPTTANKYSCHVTMTGFFNVANEDQQREINQILDSLIVEFKQCSPLPSLSLKSLLVRNQLQQPVHLLLPVIVPEQYHTIMTTLANKCRAIVPLRLKKINHISLAYWDESKATTEQLQIWNDSIQNLVFEQIQQFADSYFESVPLPNSWDIALYKRSLKGELVGQAHIFEELGRWSL